jgi:hypothetical protein
MKLVQLLIAPSFQAFDIHSTIIDGDALFIFPLGIYDCLYSARHHSV